MEETAITAPEKGWRRLIVAAGAVLLLILALVVFAFVSGMAGNSCNCGPLPRITASAEGDTIVVTYTGIWSDRGGMWSAKRLPDVEMLLIRFHYLVKSSDGTEVRQDQPAPGPGQDQTVRIEHAATPGKDQVIVSVDYSDGSTAVVYDMYV